MCVWRDSLLLPRMPAVEGCVLERKQTLWYQACLLPAVEGCVLVSGVLAGA